jgi:hypothetical protein
VAWCAARCACKQGQLCSPGDCEGDCSINGYDDNGAATQGHSVVRLGQETGPISLGTPGSSPAPEATLERGAPRENQAKTENYMALYL